MLTEANVCGGEGEQGEKETHTYTGQHGSQRTRVGGREGITRVGRSKEKDTERKEG